MGLGLEGLGFQRFRSIAVRMQDPGIWGYDALIRSYVQGIPAITRRASRNRGPLATRGSYGSFGCFPKLGVPFLGSPY